MNFSKVFSKRSTILSCISCEKIKIHNNILKLKKSGYSPLISEFFASFLFSFISISVFTRKLMVSFGIFDFKPFRSILLVKGTKPSSLGFHSMTAYTVFIFLLYLNFLICLKRSPNRKSPYLVARLLPGPSLSELITRASLPDFVGFSFSSSTSRGFVTFFLFFLIKWDFFNCFFIGRTSFFTSTYSISIG